MIVRVISLVVAAGLFANATLAQTQQRPLADRLAEVAAANRHRLAFDGKTFSGPAWDLLLSEGRSSQFFLLGEDHGIAENAKLAGELFRALAPAGYAKFVIEVSPQMATELDRAARQGVDGLRRMYSIPGSEPAFFGMTEEAELLATVRSIARDPAPVFWGVDYEVGGDRLLITTLERKKKPAAAEAALAKLKTASAESWKQYASTKNPQFIYSVAGDPALVREVRDAWPNRDAEASSILETLEETFEINRLWMGRQGWASNERRSTFMRKNFVAHWLAEKRAGRKPRVFAKLGASHLSRGRNMTETYDLGTLLPEVAMFEGGRAFQLLVLPGAGTKTAVFNPVEWTYAPAPAKDGYAKGLEPILSAVHPDAFTLVDLRPLRPLLGSWREGVSPELMRTVHGFDAVLVLSGSTPSSNLRRMD